MYLNSNCKMKYDKSQFGVHYYKLYYNENILGPITNITNLGCISVSIVDTCIVTLIQPLPENDTF